MDGGGQAGGYHSGTNPGEETVSPYLWSGELQRLDVVTLTQAHHDHIDGLRSVLPNWNVRN